MSSNNTYTLKIAIDESKIRELEKRLMGAMNGTGLGGANPAKQGSGSDIGKNIAKLGAIALGVTSVVALVQKLVSMTVDASPMLSQMLKLLNFSIMLILRPIGDFFGFFLRPLVVYFLRSVALPFYRQFRPIWQKLGWILGSSVLNNWLSVSEFQKERQDSGDPLANLKGNISGWGVIVDFFDDLANMASGQGTEGEGKYTEKIQNWITNSEANFLKVSTFFSGIGTSIDAIDTATAFDNFKSNITGWLEAFDAGQYIVSEVGKWIAGIEFPDLTDIWTDFTTDVSTWVDEFIESLKKLITGIPAAIANALGIGGGGGDDNSTTNNFFGDAMASAQESADYVWETGSTWFESIQKNAENFMQGQGE